MNEVYPGEVLSAVEQRQARLIRVITISGLAVLAVSLASQMYFGTRPITLVVGLIGAFNLGLTLWLVATGRISLARYLLPASGWLISNAIVLLLPSVNPLLFVALNSVNLLLAGALLDHDGVLIFAALTALLSISIGLGELAGVLSVYLDPIENWLSAGPVFALVTIFSYYTFRDRYLAMQAANQRAAETETLLQASHVVAASLDMDNTIRQILLQLEQVVPYRTASVQILKDGALEIVGGRGWDEAEAVLGLQFPVPGDNPNSKVIESRQPYILDDAPAVFEAFRQPPHDHIRSLLGVPLIIGDELIGMLSIDHSQPGFYDQSHARLAQAFADQVAVAIQNASHFQAEQRRRQLAAMLQDITQITSASLELDEVVQRVASLTCQAMELDLVIVLLRPSPAEPLELTELHACHLDLPQPQLEELKRQLSLNLPADKLLQLAPGFSPSLLQADNLPPEAPDRMRQWIEQGQALLVPLIAAGHSTGLMLLLRLSPSPPFNSQAADMALTIGQSVAASLDNAKLYAQMERMAITDSLTNLYNRRGLTQLGQREIERARRFDRSFSVLMLDLDHFKQLNDSYGHPAGDEVLHQLADLLGQLVRSIDVVARYGGEEFALLLPECHFDCAQVVAERLRQAIASTSFSTSAGDLNLTISLGIASGSNLPLELESLLEAADRALYAAKEAGRNQSWAWHPQGPRPALP